MGSLNKPGGATSAFAEIRFAEMEDSDPNPDDAATPLKNNQFPSRRSLILPAVMAKRTGAMRRWKALTLAACALLAIVTVAPGQNLTRGPDNSAHTASERTEAPGEAISVEGLIRLDATLTDQSGHPVAGLERADFTLFDNGQPQKIVAFRSSKRSSSNPNDSLAVVLLVDTLNLSADLAYFERKQVAQFLNQNSGKLAVPVKIYTLEDSGFFLTSSASTNGAALANDVASDNKSAAYFLAPHAQLDQFSKAPIETSLTLCSALSGLRALATIATAEVARPGRKLLFRIGPGLGVHGTGAFAPERRRFAAGYR